MHRLLSFILILSLCVSASELDLRFPKTFTHYVPLRGTYFVPKMKRDRERRLDKRLNGRPKKVLYAVTHFLGSAWTFEKVENDLVLPPNSQPTKRHPYGYHLVRRGDTVPVCYDGVLYDAGKDTVTFTLTQIPPKISPYRQPISVNWDERKKEGYTHLALSYWHMYAGVDSLIKSHNPKMYPSLEKMQNYIYSRPSDWKVTSTTVKFPERRYGGSAQHYKVWDADEQLRLSTIKFYYDDRVIRQWDSRGVLLKAEGGGSYRWKWWNVLSFVGAGKSSQLGWNGTAGVFWERARSVRILKNGDLHKSGYPTARYGFLSAGEAGMTADFGFGGFRKNKGIGATLWGAGVHLGGGWKEGIRDYERGELYGGVSGVLSLPAIAMFRGAVFTPITGEQRGKVMFSANIDVNLLWPTIGPFILIFSL